MIAFFFQAEDGIRSTSVTGVQTCALPISTAVPTWHDHAVDFANHLGLLRVLGADDHTTRPGLHHCGPALPEGLSRSEERRVGKTVELGGHGNLEIEDSG